MSQCNPSLLLSFSLLSYPPVLSSTPKNTKINSDRENYHVHFPEFGGLSRGPGYFGPELEAETINPGRQSFSPHGIVVGCGCSTVDHDVVEFEEERVCLQLPDRVRWLIAAQRGTSAMSRCKVRTGAGQIHHQGSHLS